MSGLPKFAFPSVQGDPSYVEEGMTLRDYFAAQAVIGVSAEGIATAEQCARWAYELADAMMIAREA